MIILTARQAAGLAPLGIDFASHPDYLVFDPDALDALDIEVRPTTIERMRLAAGMAPEVASATRALKDWQYLKPMAAVITAECQAAAGAVRNGEVKHG